MTETRNMHRIATAIWETIKWKDNIKMDLREVGSNDGSGKGMELIHVMS
jgi:hypothetical protein